jgi:uncharacterized membrane protein
MLADKNPVFRKAVIPWYNSTTAYVMVVLFMLLVILFAIAGITVARDNPAYQGFIWIPAVLLTMSIAILTTTIVRLIKRYTQKSPSAESL